MTYRTFKSFILEFMPGDEKLQAARDRAADRQDSTNDIAARHKERTAAMVQAGKDRLERGKAIQMNKQQNHADQVRRSMYRSKKK